MKYAGFWSRTLSLIIDTTLLISVYIVFWNFLHGYSTTFALCGTLLLLTLTYVYEIYFHARWGQTIGKMITKIRVTKIDGTKIELKEALKRSSVSLLLSTVAIYGLIISYTSIDNSVWTSLSLSQQNILVANNNPIGNFYNISVQCWGWSEILILLFNKKKRAIHDYIANTVVIHS